VHQFDLLEKAKDKIEVKRDFMEAAVEKMDRIIEPDDIVKPTL
jgi:hypothetical protein